MKLNRGFTLLEMMVAIGVFAVIATISFASLTRFLDNQAVLESRVQELNQIQLAFSVLEQDFLFIADRAVRDEYGDQQAAILTSESGLIEDELIRFTARRWDPSLPGMAVLSRVAYKFEDGNLVRVNWAVLDKDQEADETQRILLSGIRSVDLSYMVTDEEQGLGVSRSESAWTNQEEFPDGIEVRFVMGDGRDYRRIMEIKHDP